MKYLKFILLLLCGTSCSGQQPDISCDDEGLDKMVKKYLSFSIPVISVDQLKDSLSKYTILDIREKEEYDVSHLPGAIHFGYDNPLWKKLKEIESDKPILVYCSIGYRSEKMGKKLIKKGYTDVQNLYGSIFEWANQGQPLLDNQNQPTNKVHGYNKKWSQWIKNPDCEKVY